MPLIDMPLDELKVYQGRNPRPDDFDQYWDSAIAEMKSIDPKIELIPVHTNWLNVECFDLFFTGVDGARIYAKYLRPKGVTEPHPGVACFHGYSGDSGDWCGYLSWVNQGFSVVALDCRGQAGRSEDTGGVTGNTLNGHIIRGLEGTPDKLLFKSVYLDCAQLASILMDMPEVDATRVGATGGSQGGGLTLACAALEPRVKRVAPVFPFLCDYQRVWEMDLAAGAYIELKTYFRQFDPRHEREQQIWNKLGYIDNQHLAPRIKGDVMMILGLMDNICPPSTQFAAYNKIKSPKELVIYPDFGHEGIPNSGDIIIDFMLGL